VKKRKNKLGGELDKTILPDEEKKNYSVTIPHVVEQTRVVPNCRGKGPWEKAE